MTAGDPLALVRLVRNIAGEEAQKVGQRFGDGTADTLEGNYAAVRKAGASVATPGFFVPPYLALEPGDHVFWFDDGGYKLIMLALNENRVLANSIEERRLMGSNIGGAQPYAATAQALAWQLPMRLGDSPPGAISLTRVVLWTDTEAGTLDGSNKWTLDLYTWEDAFTAPIATWVLDGADDLDPQLREQVIVATYGFPEFRLKATKTGAPPNLWLTGEITYREL